MKQNLNTSFFITLSFFCSAMQTVQAESDEGLQRRIEQTTAKNPMEARKRAENLNATAKLQAEATEKRNIAAVHENIGDFNPKVQMPTAAEKSAITRFIENFKSLFGFGDKAKASRFLSAAERTGIESFKTLDTFEKTQALNAAARPLIDKFKNEYPRENNITKAYLKTNLEKDMASIASEVAASGILRSDQALSTYYNEKGTPEFLVYNMSRLSPFASSLKATIDAYNENYGLSPNSSNITKNMMIDFYSEGFNAELSKGSSLAELKKQLIAHIQSRLKSVDAQRFNQTGQINPELLDAMIEKISRDTKPWTTPSVTNAALTEPAANQLTTTNSATIKADTRPTLNSTPATPRQTNDTRKVVRPAAPLDVISLDFENLLTSYSAKKPKSTAPEATTQEATDSKATQIKPKPNFDDLIANWGSK